MKNKKPDYGKRAEEIYQQIQAKKRREEFIKKTKKALKRIKKDFK